MSGVIHREESGTDGSSTDEGEDRTSRTASESLPLLDARLLPGRRRARRRASQLWHFRGSITRPARSLCPLRKAGYPSPTQNSVPTGGQPLSGGGLAAQECYKEFQLDPRADRGTRAPPDLPGPGMEPVARGLLPRLGCDRASLLSGLPPEAEAPTPAFLSPFRLREPRP